MTPSSQVRCLGIRLLELALQRPASQVQHGIKEGRGMSGDDVIHLQDPDLAVSQGQVLRPGLMVIVVRPFARHLSPENRLEASLGASKHSF